MREPLKAGLARADAMVVMLPTDVEAADPELLAVFGALPVFIARLTPGAAIRATGQVRRHRQAVEGRAVVEGGGVRPGRFRPLPDHAAYSDKDMKFLIDRAAVYDAGLVTTEKDWVRLTPDQRARVTAWPVVARFEDAAAFTAFLTSRIQSAR